LRNEDSDWSLIGECWHRRQVHPDRIRLLVDHKVNETGVLVTETVVVLPNMRGEQVLRELTYARGYLCGRLQPLGVLVKHGVHDVDECLSRKEAVASGE